MHSVAGYLWSVQDTARRRLEGQSGQATVEYVGLVVVLGTGIGLIVSALGAMGFAAKIGAKLISGITKGLDAVMPN